MDEIKRIAAKIKSNHKYFSGTKGILEKPYNKIKDLEPDDFRDMALRVAKLGAIDLSWFLFCLGKFTLNDIFMDNYFINKWSQEKVKIQNDDSRFKKVFKKLQKSYPVGAARARLWMVYTLLVIMGINVGKVSQAKENISKNYEKIVKKPSKKDKFNPSDKNFINDFVNEYWQEIVFGLLEFETYYDKPELHKFETRYTYGPGLTWVYIDGKQHPCVGKYKNMAENFSDEEIWDQVRQHCMYRGECLSIIKNKLNNQGIEEISADQILGLLFAGYQIPSTTKMILSRLQNAKDDEQKTIDAFIAGKEVKKCYRSGTNKRRWWCAMLYSGKIKIDDFADMDRDAFAKININRIMQNGQFLHDTEIIDYALSRQNIKNGTVQDFIYLRNIFDVSGGVLGQSENNKMKTIAFNDGIKKIKSKQNNDFVYSLDKEY